MFQLAHGLLSGSIFVLNTVFWCSLLLLVSFFKLAIPIAPVRNFLTHLMTSMAEAWTDVNNLNIKVLQNVEWRIRGIDGLDRTRSYLVLSNHQSWMDIVILQKIFNRKIPFMRFFLKQELIYVPFLGLAWWALEFPFMKRHSKEYLEKYPEKRKDDLLATRKALKKFSRNKISIINFLEGTRFTPQKWSQQKSSFKNLLPPKAGGVAFVLQAMGDQLDAIIDVTICYPKGVVSLWDAFCGRLPLVVVDVRKLPVPAWVCEGDYLSDSVFREKFQAWITEIWQHKDELLSSMSR